MSYKFLRLVNSVAFYSVNKIESLDNALVRLGLEEINKYVYLLMFKQIAVGTPNVVTKTAIIRGKFCELLAKESGHQENSATFFLAGMFSLIDVIVKKPKEKALNKLPLAESVKKAIMGIEENKYFNGIKLIENFEKGFFDKAEEYIKRFKVERDKINSLYFQAIQDSNYLYQNF